MPVGNSIGLFDLLIFQNNLQNNIFQNYMKVVNVLKENLFYREKIVKSTFLPIIVQNQIFKQTWSNTKRPVVALSICLKLLIFQNNLCNNALQNCINLGHVLKENLFYRGKSFLPINCILLNFTIKIIYFWIQALNFFVLRNRQNFFLIYVYKIIEQAFYKIENLQK